MAAVPLLSDIQATKPKIAGDRVVVTVSQNVSIEEKRKIERAVVAFFKVDLRVLIVNNVHTSLDLLPSIWYPEGRALSSDKIEIAQGPAFRLAQLKCTSIQLHDTDIVFSKTSEEHYSEVLAELERWVDQLCEVRVIS